MIQEPIPMISDEQLIGPPYTKRIGPKSNVPVTIHPLPMKAKEVRDLYEADRAKHLEEISTLKQRLRECVEAIEYMMATAGAGANLITDEKMKELSDAGDIMGKAFWLGRKALASAKSILPT